jgi:iron complex transport system ATP-binding protein
MIPAIEAEHVSVSYDGATVLADVSLVVEQGEFLSILGPNGSGKTTLIRALTGLVTDIGGEVLLFGKPLSSFRRREFARHVSILPQNPSMLLPFMVADIVLMGRFPYIRRFETSGPRDAEAVEYAMELMNIRHLGKRHLMELSGGEVRRVFIAQAIAQEAGILFLDEPTANLDISYQMEIFELLERFNREMAKTIVLVTHDINHAARFAGRIILLKNGSIYKSGRPEDVINRHDLKFVFNKELCIEYDSRNKPYILL